MFKRVIPLIQDQIVGREKELELIIACLDAGKHILLEGPPGTSKSTILGLVARHSNMPIHVLEGNADLTPAKLIGNFDPSLVIEHGLKPEYFIKGPLFMAMEEGGLLYIDEFNRMASDASNALIRAIEEHELVVPRFGVIKAHDNFRVVLAQNPFDDVGVGKISRALYDRLLRIRLDYQSELEEKRIVSMEANNPGSRKSDIIGIAVQLTRATRFHPEIKQGASVRGAIDMVTLVSSLVNLDSGSRTNYETLRDAAWASLSGKIWLDPSSEKSAEVIIEDLLVDVVNSRSLTFDYMEDEEFLAELKKK
ncbi:MAG: AAA family ATPase [Candidatus Odinarchaeota archaeon]